MPTRGAGGALADRGAGGAHANRGCVDDEIGVGEVRHHPHDADVTGEAGGRARPVLVAVDDRDALGAVPHQGEDDGPSCSPGTYDGAPPTGGLESEVRPQAADEPLAVGVVTDQVTVVVDDTVDGAERRGIGRELVNGFGDPILVRHGDRQASDPEGPHALEGRPGLAGRHVERDVDPVETGGRKRGVVDARRSRVADRVTDHRGQPGLTRDRTPAAHAVGQPQPRSRSMQTCLASSNSPAVSTKRWAPSTPPSLVST